VTANAAASEQAPGEHALRAVPYHCPFCGEEDLRPVPSGAVDGLTRGGWHCRSCLRVFSLSFFGTQQPHVESDPR
jgi:transposase-like protein